MPELGRLISSDQVSSRQIRIEGVVLWVSPKQDQLMLLNDSGAVSIRGDLHSGSVPKLGQRLGLEGTFQIGHGEIVGAATVDNDGMHGIREQSGTVFLAKGLHRFRLERSIDSKNSSLYLEYSGPGMSRQPVPGSALFRSETGGSEGNPMAGLNYFCYEEGEGPTQLPDFIRMSPSEHGWVTNIDWDVRNHDKNVALVFSGYFNASAAGKYQFWLRSEDSSRLFIENMPVRVNVLGAGQLPVPRRILSDRTFGDKLMGQWVEAEGTVSGVEDSGQGVWIKLASGIGQFYLKVLPGINVPGNLLLHCRIRCSGVYQSSLTADGQTVPCLLAPNLETMTFLETVHWNDYPVCAIGSIRTTGFQGKADTIIHVHGIVSSNRLPNLFLVGDETGRIWAETVQSLPSVGDSVDALGWSGGTEGTLRNCVYKRSGSAMANEHDNLPLLTEVAQVRNLSRTEAQRGYPVMVRGVVTAHTRFGADFFIQDVTSSIYVILSGASVPPRIGDYWEVEGVSSVQFAPNVLARRAVYLGPGVMPEPLQASGEELINGSLDAKYIEIQGIATEVADERLTLLTRERAVRLLLAGPNPGVPRSLEGALIRVRGVLSPARDENQKMLAELRLFNPWITIDEPSPSDLFGIPLKHASDLLFFDAHADSLRRVRIAGQVMHKRDDECFLMDGSNGWRFESKAPLKLEVGGIVEAVGFPDLKGPSPVLREAVVRSLGNAALPVAQQLSEQELLNGAWDAKLVCVTGHLVGSSANQSEQVLEMQTGSRRYMARLRNECGLLPPLLPGSELQLTGVYAGQGGDRPAGREIDSLELLLNSPAQVRVLERPSWWSLRHTLTVIAGLVCVIILILGWVAMLRREVEQRSRQLRDEILRRDKIERQRALEEERARIARDLHDELGASLTQIRFLSAVESCENSVPEATRTQLREVSEKSRDMVISLDEIVWAVNPANDSLASLVSYLCHVAQEFFRATPVLCLLDVDEALPSVTLTSEARHSLYLSVREALNNSAKHSHATEVWLRIHWQERTLHIVVEDNGCGFSGSSKGPLGDGLVNMRHRLAKIGGHFECETRPGSGIICRMTLPFA